MESADADHNRIQEIAKEYVAGLIDDFVIGLTTIEDETEANALKEKLYDLFVGEDGLLDIDKILNAKEIIRNADTSVGGEEYTSYLEKIVREFFGQGDASEILERLTGREEIAETIAKTIEDLIAYGVSQADIKNA